MRIILATVVAAFVASVSSGQTKYSRARSQSPTPTPTPTPAARILPIQSQRTMQQRTMPMQSPTPLRNPATAPTRSNYAAPPAQIQSRQMPTPMPTPAKTSFQSQRTMSQRMMPTQSPTPLRNPATLPARSTYAAPPTRQIQSRQMPTPTPTPGRTSYQNQRTMSQRMMPTQPSSTRPSNPPPTQMRSNYAAMPGQVQPRQMPTPPPIPVKPTPTPVPPPDVKAYLDRQLANSQDKKFHMTVNGKDFPLTPFHVWPQKSTGPNSTSTSISMRSDDGRVYDIEFVTTGAQVTGIRVSRINGESVR